MANKKISDLTEITSHSNISDDDLLELSEDLGGSFESKSAKADTYKDYLLKHADFDTEVDANTNVTNNTTHRNTTTGNPHSVTHSEVGAAPTVHDHDHDTETINKDGVSSDSQHLTQAQHDLLVNDKADGLTDELSDAKNLHVHQTNISPHVGTGLDSKVPIAANIDPYLAIPISAMIVDKYNRESYLYMTSSRPDNEYQQLYIAYRPLGSSDDPIVDPEPKSPTFLPSNVTFYGAESISCVTKDSLTFLVTDNDTELLRSYFIIHNGDLDPTEWDAQNVFDLTDNFDSRSYRSDHPMDGVFYISHTVLGTEEGDGRILHLSYANYHSYQGIAAILKVYTEADFRLNYNNPGSLTNLLTDGGAPIELFNTRDVNTYPDGWVDYETGSPGNIISFKNFHALHRHLCYNNITEKLGLHIYHRMYTVFSDRPDHSGGIGIMNSYDLSIDDLVNGNSNWDPIEKTDLPKPDHVSSSSSDNPYENAFQYWNQSMTWGTFRQWIISGPTIPVRYYAGNASHWNGFMLYYDYSLDKLYGLYTKYWCEYDSARPLHSMPYRDQPTGVGQGPEFEFMNGYYFSPPIDNIYSEGFQNFWTRQLLLKSYDNNDNVFVYETQKPSGYEESATLYGSISILKDTSEWGEYNGVPKSKMEIEPNTATLNKTLPLLMSNIYADPTLNWVWSSYSIEKIALTMLLSGSAPGSFTCFVDSSFNPHYYLTLGSGFDIAEIRVATATGEPVLEFINTGITFPDIDDDPSSPTHDFLPYYRHSIIYDDITDIYNSVVVPQVKRWLGWGYDSDNGYIYMMGLDKNITDTRPGDPNNRYMYPQLYIFRLDTPSSSSSGGAAGTWEKLYLDAAGTELYVQENSFQSAGTANTGDEPLHQQANVAIVTEQGYYYPNPHSINGFGGFEGENSWRHIEMYKFAGIDGGRAVVDKKILAQMGQAGRTFGDSAFLDSTLQYHVDFGYVMAAPAVRGLHIAPSRNYPDYPSKITDPEDFTLGGDGFFNKYYDETIYIDTQKTLFAAIPIGHIALIGDARIHIGGYYYPSLTTAITNSGGTAEIPLNPGTADELADTYIYLSANGPNEILVETTPYRSTESVYNKLLIALMRCNDLGIVESEIYDNDLISILSRSGGTTIIVPEETKTFLISSGSDIDTVQDIIDGVSKFIPCGETITFQFQDGDYEFEDALTFENFFGGGKIVIQGNISETAGLHTDQSVVLDFTTPNVSSSSSASDFLNAINIVDCSVQIEVTHLKVITSQWPNATACLNLNKVTHECIIQYNYFVGGDTSSGYAIMIHTCPTVKAIDNYIDNVQVGLQALEMSTLFSQDNESIGVNPAIGLGAIASIIYKDGNQPAASTAEATSWGGQIW